METDQFIMIINIAESKGFSLLTFDRSAHLLVQAILEHNI